MRGGGREALCFSSNAYRSCHGMVHGVASRDAGDRMTVYWISWRLRPNGELKQRGFLTAIERELFAAMLFRVEIVERWER